MHWREPQPQPQPQAPRIDKDEYGKVQIVHHYHHGAS
jgi:hypothetical protein